MAPLQLQGHLGAGEVVNVCPKCGQKNDPSSLFCKHCGAKLGEEVVEKKEQPKKVKASPEDREKRKDKVSFIFFIISMSLLLYSMVLILGLSFAPFMEDEFYPASDYTIIQYVINVFKQGIGNLVSDYQIIPIVNAFALLAWLVALVTLCIVFITLSTINLVKNIKSKTYCDFSKQTIALLILYISLAAYFIGFVIKQDGGETAKLSGNVTHVIIISGAALIFNLFTKEFVEDKHSLFNIIFRGVVRLVIFIFATVVVFSIGGYRFHLITTFSDSVGTTVTSDYGNLGLVSFLLKNIMDIEDTALPFLILIIAFSLAAFVLEALSLVFGGQLIKGCFSRSINEKQKHISRIIFSGLMLSFAISTTIFNAVTKMIINKIDSVDYYGVKMVSRINNALPITCIVMSALLLAVSIISLVIDKSKNKEEIAENEGE